MDMNKAKVLRAKMNEVFQAFLEKEYGVKVTIGRGSFTESNLTFKVEIAEVNATTGVAETRTVLDFKALAPLYGLKAEDFGKKFAFQRYFGRGPIEQYEICGLKATSHKFPILAKRADGRVFKFPAAVVQRGLGKVTPTQPTREDLEREAAEAEADAEARAEAAWEAKVS